VTDRSKKPKPSTHSYKVGYRKPPSQTQFKKGVSGNPKGRPRGATPGRALKLAAQEIFRPIRVKEGDRIVSIEAFRAILRQVVANAAKGSGPAQRLVVDFIRQIEHGLAAQAVAEDKENPAPSYTDEDRARALAAFIAKTQAMQGLKT